MEIFRPSIEIDPSIKIVNSVPSIGFPPTYDIIGKIEEPEGAIAALKQLHGHWEEFPSSIVVLEFEFVLLQEIHSQVESHK